jgi:hypothetical protein
MRRPVVQAVVALLACGVLLGGVIGGGRLMRERLRDSPKHQFPFKDIDCPAPPGLDRATFLGEVQYLSELPDQIPLLDDTLPKTLAAAFERHAWVERAEVVIGPGRVVQVRPTFRTPVLEVSYAPVKGGALTTREVDANGVLLPRGADVAGLPRLRPAVSPPAGSAGQPWGDALVEHAAAIAGVLHPYQPQLKLTQLDMVSGEFRLATDRGAVVVWGKPPGDERQEEPAADEKVRRLREYYDKHGGLDRPDSKAVHDLRTAGK